MNVPGKRCPICHDRIVADNTVMRDVAIGHHPIIVANDGLTSILDRTATYSTKLADRVSIANGQARWLISVFLVLRITADRGKPIDTIVSAYFRRTSDNGVTTDSCTAVNFDIIANHGVRADLNVICDNRLV